MGNSGHKLADKQQDSEVSWRECGQRQSELRGNRALRNQLFGAIPDDWHEAALEMDFSKLDEVRGISRGSLTVSNYTRTLRTLLKMEQAHGSIDIRRFDMFKKRLVRLDGSHRYRLQVDGLSKGPLKLMPRDYVVLRDLENNYEITIIKSIGDDFVTISGGPLSSATFYEGPLDIYFVQSGFLYTIYQRGLDRFDRDSSLRGRLFQDTRGNIALESILCRSHEYYHDDCDLLNEADRRLSQFNGPQRQAILNILEARFWPKPYILFGPPGTGKTHTLAEAIVQIYTEKPNCKILYCANSNNCVDQMADKLKNIPLIRSYNTCRLFPGKIPDDMRKKRIVLTTNMKSMSLMHNGFKFDYVFIDEAGHAHEPESLLPICCLAPTGRLVLAGDPKQLGPVVKCEQASMYGLGFTLLERLLEFDIYQRDRATGQYDSGYITKLIVSYRCDPRVLSISNRLFYENELLCVNETPKSLLKMMRITKPLQFHHVEGQEEQPGYSSSWRNSEEVDQCVDLIIQLYKMGLTPDQIGVISPYKLQTDEIRENLDRKLKSLRAFLEERFREVKKSESQVTTKLAFDLERLKLGEVEVQDRKAGDRGEVECKEVELVKERADKWLCKIDSVDAFQGNEREVIIISTVKTESKGEHAFVNDARRFNVAISRAKWLVFVFGHKGFLQDQSNWNQFIRHAGREMSKWPALSGLNAKHPFDLFRLLFWLNN